LKEYKIGKKTYTNCFKGKRLIKWLMNVYSTAEKPAGNESNGKRKLMNQNVF
jgi:hypothetical protein